MISCFQLSNGIMQNTITLERTLQCVEAGQVLNLKGGICGVVQNNTNSNFFLLSALRAI